MRKIGFIYPNHPLTTDIGGGVSYLQFFYSHRNRYTDFELTFISSYENVKDDKNILVISRSKNPLIYAINFFKFVLFNPEFKSLEILHFNHNFLAWIGCLFKRSNQKVVLTYHGLTGTYLKKISGIFYPVFRQVLIRVEREMLMRIDKVIFVSQATLDGSKHLLNSKFSYTVIPASFDNDIFQGNLKACRKLNLAWTGRFSEVKDPERALSIFKHLRNIADCKISMTFNGFGELLPKCKRIASSDDDVRFNGQVQKEYLPQVYENAFALLVTSKSEASPTVIKEALSMGMYVLSLDVGDAKHQVNCESGMIFSSSNDEDIAREIWAFYSEKKHLNLWRHDNGLVNRDVFKEIITIYKDL